MPNDNRISREALHTWAAPDPFDQLDHALAGQRLLTKAILAAIERRDVRAIDALSNLRAELDVDVDRLLVVTDRMVRRG